MKLPLQIAVNSTSSNQYVAVFQSLISIEIDVDKSGVKFNSPSDAISFFTTRIYKTRRYYEYQYRRG